MRVGLVCLAGLLAAACSTPRPFDHTSTGLAEISAPGDTLLCVSAFPALPPELAATLRGALADELVRREVLAVASDACPPATPRILAWDTHSADPGIAALMLSRPPKGGRTVPPVAVSLPVPAPALWDEASARWAMMIADRLGYRPPAIPSARSPLDLAGRLSAPPAAAPDPATPAPSAEKILVELVDGAGGDGNTLLRFAMIGHLRRAGFHPVVKADDAARFAVKGNVEIGEPQIQGTTEVRKVRIVWTVKDANGKTLSTLEQANAIPAATLARAWGRAADLIAAAAAPGIADTVMRARAELPPAQL